MRSLIVAVTAGLILGGCSTDLSFLPKTQPSANPTPTADPSTWVMSPDSFGPITMETTRAQAMATGYFRAAHPPCSERRLDWRGQAYQDELGNGDGEPAKPFLPAVTFGEGGFPEYIDPGPDTVTDRGVRRSDSLSRLQITYGDDLIPGLDQSPGRGSFAVTGDRSHLLFVVMFDKVVGFFIASGHVEEPEDVMTVAGLLTKSDNIRPGRRGTC